MTVPSADALAMVSCAIWGAAPESGTVAVTGLAVLASRLTWVSDPTVTCVVTSETAPSKPIES
jgi:hypothetical protein